MVEIRQKLVSSNKYSVKCPYQMSPEFIVVHNTANDASANNEVSYMISNNNKVSYHYAVDDKEIVQAIPENRNAFHAGDGSFGNGNRKGIAIEICYSKSGGEKFDKAEENAAEFIASKLKEKGWGIDKVKKHQDFSNKYCPHRTLDYGWDRFLNKIKKYLNETSNNDDIKFFDYELYYCMYPDLQKAYGLNETKLKEHYKVYGIKEGRIGSYVFDPIYYVNKYSDLKAAFGTDYVAAYNHFIANGVKEGRQASILFCAVDYVNMYADLKKVYGKNYTEAINHFLTYGMNEERQASNEFNIKVYKNTYEDLRKAFGNNNKEYFKHYLMYGKNEGRKSV